MTSQTKKPVLGMVLYTDGGCRPNPGYAGFGLHGYTFEVQRVHRGIGHTTHVATARGYEFKNDSNFTKISKEEFEAYEQLDHLDKVLYIENLCNQRERITVKEFIDKMVAVPGNESTNNTAELVAITCGIKLAMDMGVSIVTIRADSMHVINGVLEWADGWKSRGWVTKTGSPVSSRELWEDMIAVRDEYRAQGGMLRIEWVKGHKDDIGNLSADDLAKGGVFASQGRRELSKLVASPGDSDYWGSALTQRHPMLTQRYAYFVGNEHYRTTRTYYTGNQGKEADLIAKKSSEAGYAVITIDEGVPDIQFVIDRQCSMGNDLQSMYLLDIDAFYKSCYRYLNLYREDFLYKPLPHRYDLWALDDTPITRELRPPVIAMRAIDALVIFSMVLDDYLNNKGTCPTGTDITDLIYSKTEKVEKSGEVVIETKINADYTVGQPSVKVKAKVDGIDDLVELTLSTGVDIADRNMFKRIEHLNPEVHVITWGNDPLCFHYATVVKADGCRGLWAGPFANMRVLNEPRKGKTG